ncbi:MAG: UDP-N-acetylmuramate dehydrogenase [Actinomycetaceae bacterium]|nr:UDP-N-acetylmuramate dehydrogenase [Actinomycetaceae bacterium]
MTNLRDTADVCAVPTNDTKITAQPPVPWSFISEGEADAPCLSELTTLGIGGRPAEYVCASTEEEFIAAVQNADAQGDFSRLLVLGGGSNLVCCDADFRGRVVRDMRRGITVEEQSGCGGVAVNVPAGQPWDEFVVQAIESGWMGVEALSGIPGTVGAAPVQNIGAYGQEVAETISSVTVWDRLEQRKRLFPVGEMGFGYRTSRIKKSLTGYGEACAEKTQRCETGASIYWGPTGRWVVLQVQFQMRFANLSRPVAYSQLAKLLGVKLGTRVPSVEVRKAVLELRRSKGMVLDWNDADSHSAGSFFTNPVIAAEDASMLPDDAPRYPVTDHTLITNIAGEAPEVEGLVKTSAAWLIDHAGFTKGYRLSVDAPAALSAKHALAITNTGGASSADILELARTVRDGVRKRFGITLIPEPVFVGMSLDD